MKTASDSLTIRSFPVRALDYGEANTVTAAGEMTVDPTVADRLAAEEELITGIAIRIIRPDEHRQHTDTILDVLPLAAKVSGELGHGVTHALTGVYVLLTCVDENHRQVCNFGSCEGILAEKVAWGMPGTPLENDLLISFDVVLKGRAWSEREGVNAAHRACDRFCQLFRQPLRRFPAAQCAEERVAKTLEGLRADGAVFCCNAIGNNHVDFARAIERTEECGIATAALALCPWSDFVVQNKYRSGSVLCCYKTQNAAEAGDETNVLAENTITAFDARKGIALLKLKLRGRKSKQ